MKTHSDLVDKKELTEEEEAEIAAAEKLGVGDFFIGLAIAAAVFLLQLFWQYPGIHPAAWNDAAIAAGVRPAELVAPGYWHTVAGWVFSAFGISGGAAVLRLAGHGALALICVFVYAFLREVLTFVMRARPQQSPRRKLVMRIAAAIGALAFAAADPVWSAGQFFCETTLLLVLTVGAIEFFFAFLRKGTLKYSYVCAILLGLLSAETPFGAVLTVAFIALNFIVIRAFPNLESPFFKPALIEVGKWHMTFLFLVAFIAGVGFNCVGYIARDGLVPGGGTVGSLPLQYLQSYIARATSAAGLAGWILLLGFALGPFVVSIVRFSTAADEEKFLSYSTGIVFLFCGVLAFSQCASLSALWFWTYVPVASTYLLSLCALMCVLTVACAITILGVDSLCRDHSRLAQKFFGSDEYGDEEEDHVMSPGLTESLRKFGIVIVPLMLVGAVVPGRRKESTRQMLEIIDDAVAATLDECGDAEYIFTDGNLDVALELESRRRGGNLKCVSLIGGGRNAAYLRTRGIEDDKEDYFSFQFDGAIGLRGWIRDKPEKLAKSAVQIGFDLWKRDGKKIPPIGGMLSRPTSTDEEARKAGEARALALVDRVLDVVGKGIGDCTEPKIKKAFNDVMWRLARMCLYRAEAYDLEGKAELAIADMDRSKRLNDANETFQTLVRDSERRSAQMMRQLTPREGLQLALVRADFQFGKAYAEIVLGADIENPDANFAMAMYYLQQHQLTLAEEYLKRCLIRKPDEPTFYNNLAMIQMELGKLDAATINAEKALRLAPESSAIQDTCKVVREAREGKKPEADAKKR